MMAKKTKPKHVASLLVYEYYEMRIEVVKNACGKCVLW